jgi:hypothetical protein
VQSCPSEIMRTASRPSVWFWILVAVVAIAAAAAAVAPGLYRTAVLGSGFLAQRLCGDVFISKRDPDAVLAEDLSGPGYELVWFFQPSVDRERRLVTASALGVGRQISVFREGLGCRHVVGKSESELRDETANMFATTPAPDLHALWPEGERVDLEALPKGVDGPALERAMDAAFAEPDPAHPRHTRALVVVYQGRIVAERHAPRFDATMPLLGWSLSKAALNALVGERVADGKLDTSKNPGRIGDGLIHFVRLKAEVLAWLGNRVFLILTSGCESFHRRATIWSG